VRAFDALAADYDASFTATPLGTLLREAVWRRLDARFAPGDRVLELACGTGEDAVHLARRGVWVTATDASPAMVEAARRKVATAGLEGMIEVQQMDVEQLPPLPGDGWEMGEGGRGGEVGRGEAPATMQFDGAFSDFGGLNCVSNLRALSHALAQRLRPGAGVLLCVMGPLVPWEWIWYLGQGDPVRAFRRLRRGGVAWRGLTVRYPSIRALRRAFSPDFRAVRINAVGALLPPTYVEEWTRRHPRLLAALARWERRLERVPPLPWLADHYLIELERRAE
jgi:SAM-dependent methyltransferase